MLQMHCAAICQMISLYPHLVTQQGPLPGSDSAGPAILTLQHSLQVLFCQISIVTLFSVATQVLILSRASSQWTSSITCQKLLLLPLNKHREEMKARCVAAHKQLNMSPLSHQLTFLMQTALHIGRNCGDLSWQACRPISYLMPLLQLLLFHQQEHVC